MPRTLRLLDLFAGCGGLTQGFLDVNQRVGSVNYRVLAAVESDRMAAATYAANFGDHVIDSPIEDVRSEDVPSVDVVVGGPPCQWFSNLGRRDPADPRNALWRHYVRLLRRAEPDYFVLENVAGFLASPQWELFQRQTAMGDLRDYRLQAHVLNAADYGCHQVRKRAVVIGHHLDVPPLPPPTATTAGSTKWPTVRDALRELPVRAILVDLPSRTLEIAGNRVPGPFTTAELHIDRELTPLVRARIAAIPYGGNRTDIPDALLPDCWRTHDSTTDVMGRLRWERPSVTIRTEFVKPEKGRYLHPTENRPLTLAEGALLQGFPLNFRWCGTKTAIAKQIGNAVPVSLSRAIATTIASLYR